MNNFFVNEVLEGIWKDRYCKNNETLDDNLKRVANYCSSNEKDKQDFYDVMKNILFFPAGRTMSNSGIGKDLTLNNCFVAPQIRDDLGDIFDKVKLGSTTHQRGGGIGYDFSQLRPKGSITSNDAVASGAVSFMDVFNAQTETILQGSRRGANMGVMSVYNMDIVDFINAKSSEKSKLNHFNVSVMVDKDFIDAVEKDSDVFLHYPVYGNDGKLLKDSSLWKYSKKVSAKEIWNLIIQKAYDNGEPGVFFYENLNNDNNLWYIENIVCSNPCAEYLAGTVYGENPITGEKLDPTQFGGACNLGSLFLHSFVNKPFTKEASIDYDKLTYAINVGVRFLDSIIDINKFPDKIYENYQKAFRTIGLGVTGLADMLAMLNLKYNSKEAQDFVYDLMNFISFNVYKASIKLSKEKGSFPFLDKEKFVQSGFIQKHVKKHPEWKEIVDGILEYGIRNSKMLSIAPTGTLSLTFGNNCSSGIEPIFSLHYDRRVKMGGQSDDDIKIVKMEDYGYHVWSSIKDGNIVKEDVFITALEMSVDDHVDMLKNITWHTDMSVSKTINVPTSYSFEDTKNIYMKAYKCGIKGCTIFRPNEIREGILISPANEKKPDAPSEQYDFIKPKSRKQMGTTHGSTYCKKCACGTLYLTINRDDDGNIVESFVHTSKGGICQANIGAINRMISLAMRSGIMVDEIVDQLSGINCPACVKVRTKGEHIDGLSCPDIIARTIREFAKDEKSNNAKKPRKQKEPTEKSETPKKKDTDKKVETSEVTEDTNICPECGSKLRNEGGCVICVGDETHIGCGWSKCN